MIGNETTNETTTHCPRPRRHLGNPYTRTSSALSRGVDSTQASLVYADQLCGAIYFPMLAFCGARSPILQVLLQEGFNREHEHLFRLY